VRRWPYLRRLHRRLRFLARPAPAPSPPGDGPRSSSPAGVSYLDWRSFPSAAADSIPAIRPEHNRLAATSGSVDSFLVPAGRRRRAIAPQRSCVDSADRDSEGDESSPGHRLPLPGQITQTANIRAVIRNFRSRTARASRPSLTSNPENNIPFDLLQRRPIRATLARATNSAQYQWVGSQSQHSKLVKPAPKVRKNRFKCNAKWFSGLY
jgi:hypothetical protein